MKKRNGFTLIELLAVIVVIVIIVLISIPIITGIITNARKGALKNSAYGLSEAASMYYAKHMDKMENYIDFAIDKNKQSGTEKLDYKGNIETGYVRLTHDGKVAVCIDDNKYYAVKNLNSSVVRVDEGVCSSEYDESIMGFVVIGSNSYIGVRLDVKAYESKAKLPSKANEGYIGVITDTEVTDYYFSDEGIENPKEGNIWIVQNSNSESNIKNEKSKLGVACVMQYEKNKWIPKESYVYNDKKWTLLSEFDDLSEYSWNYDYTGKYQIFTAPYSGLYNIELWGAQGGSNNATYFGGKGAYTKGDLYLDEGEKIYIYVGGTTTNTSAGWNGGGIGRSASAGIGYGGGGATDIRTEATSTEATWNEIASLRSRIMVAAGGAGASVYDTSSWLSYGAAGGGLEGIPSIYSGSNVLTYRSSPATQGGGGVVNGYNSGTNGGFGYGGNAQQSSWSNSGGGSGWYGGSGGSYAGSNNSGGSSYISGHKGCGSINKLGIGNGKVTSWTEKYFINTKIIDGTGYNWTNVRENYIKMPDKSGPGEVDGNTGTGYAKISLKTPMYKSKETRKQEIEKLNSIWSYGASTSYQSFTATVNGTYKIELWGAQGGSINTFEGGKGGYTSGEIYLEEGTTLYFYVGTQGGFSGGWNGGGTGRTATSGIGVGGGGATDVRTVATSPTTTWNEITSLRSRIMVAGAGSGASAYDSNTWFAYGGAGGGLKGILGTGGPNSKQYIVGSVAGQGSGGVANSSNSGSNGGFGYGGNAQQSNWSNNGGGSGWYGSSGGSYAGSVIAGGSSYISGHLGCDSIDENGIHNGSAYSYTNYIFKNTEMIDGEGYNWTVERKNKINMTQHLKNDKVDGNSGTGYARVTLIKSETKTNYVSDIKNSEKKWIYSYTPSYQKFVAPYTGTYKIQLWGAQGGSYNSSIQGGKGGYTEGQIKLDKGTKLFLFVGSQGMGITNGYNGGGAGRIATSGFGYAGGGATDVRIIGDNLAWNNATSLMSRIMVAAGGAGSSAYDTSSWYAFDGAGGGLEGIMGDGGSSAKTYKAKTVATQIAGGTVSGTNSGTNGGFGYGGNAQQSNWSNNGGGSGWFGGSGGSYAGSVLSGGSSYISGHAGCIAINSSGKSVATTSSSVNDSYSYTGYKFTDTLMIDGQGYKWTTEKKELVQMPTYDGESLITGNSEHGYAKITFVK